MLINVEWNWLIFDELWTFLWLQSVPNINRCELQNDRRAHLCTISIPWWPAHKSLGVVDNTAINEPFWHIYYFYMYCGFGVSQHLAWPYVSSSHSLTQNMLFSFHVQCFQFPWKNNMPQNTGFNSSVDMAILFNVRFWHNDNSTLGLTLEKKDIRNRVKGYGCSALSSSVRG